MNAALPHQKLADLVLLVHFGIVVFVVIGLLLVVVGNLPAWRRVNTFWFRLAHLLAMGVVVVESWLGMTCPLTTLESWLRKQAGLAPYTQSFIEHWVQRVLFYQAPPWVFATGYTVFGLFIVAAWWYFPPRFKKPQP